MNSQGRFRKSNESELHFFCTFADLSQKTVILFRISPKRTTRTLHCPSVNSKWAVTKLIFSFLAIRLSIVDIAYENPAGL